MSRLQTAADYQREIAEVESMIRMKEDLAREHGADFGMELAISSLRARQQALADEMEALGDESMPQQEIAVILEGRPVTDHSIDAGFLSIILRDLQLVVQNVIASAAGQHGRVGPVSRAVQAKSALRFAGSFPGSFGMKLETPVAELALDDPGSVSHAIESVVNLLNSGDSTAPLLTAIAPLNPRARATYKDLLEHLREHGADLRVEWNSTRGLRRAGITSRRADSALSKLHQVDVVESLRSYRGILDGAIKTRGIFEFRPEEGGTISGTVAPAAIPKLKAYFDQDCVGLITTHVATDRSTGDSRTHHRLEDLRDPGSENLPGF